MGKEEEKTTRLKVQNPEKGSSTMEMRSKTQHHPRPSTRFHKTPNFFLSYFLLKRKEEREKRNQVLGVGEKERRRWMVIMVIPFP